MSTINNSILKQKRTFRKVSFNFPLLSKYMDYAKAQDKENIYWYMKVIMAIPCVFMVLSIFAMAVMTPNYVWFVGLSIILFYINVIAHIAGTKSSFYVPLYHITVSLFFLIPLITYIISL